MNIYEGPNESENELCWVNLTRSGLSSAVSVCERKPLEWLDDMGLIYRHRDPELRLINPSLAYLRYARDVHDVWDDNKILK